MLEGCLHPESRRERILVCYALSLFSGPKNLFADELRREMADIDLRGSERGALTRAKAIDAAIRDALDTGTRDLVWRIDAGQQPVAGLVAQWEEEFARRLNAMHAAGAVLADEVEGWLAKQAVIEAEQPGPGPGSVGEGA